MNLTVSCVKTEVRPPVSRPQHLRGFYPELTLKARVRRWLVNWRT